MESQFHTAGSFVWVWVSNDQGWVKGTVQKVLQNGQLEVQLENKTVGTFKPEDCPLRNVESRMGVEDMTALSYLNEPGVLWNLNCRYTLDAIYTYTGSILIAVNPFASLPHMYGPHMMEQYKGRDLGELSPHVYAIADAAYRQMKKDSKSQSILVSGESGAGKTETSKLIMQYLAWMGNETSGLGQETEVAGQPSVERKVLESNPLLEAFGNAKTVRNDNSSRFGKFVEIQFNKQGRISGAAVRTYLLERSRVVQLTDPERNYHIFYQLCDGASPEERKQWMLKPAPEFHYLNQSSCYKLDRVDNVQEFKNTRRAMTLVGIPLDEQDAIFATVAGVLHLGNVAFQEGPDESSAVTAAAQQHLQAAATLLGVDADGLLKALTTRTRQTVDGPIVSPLDVRAAEDNRDSLAKMVYARMFDWLVEKINTAIGQDPDALALVGVLDIYGFEQFAENDFEQFCINLANEKLQQHFNQHVFKMEQAEYEREAIDWSYIQFVDNQDVLDLIERKPMGILDILDEQCRFPRATNADFANKLYGTPEVAKSARFGQPKLDRTGFRIEHYAGAVTYKTENFLAKNKDFVVAEHQQLMQQSTVAFVRALFPADPEEPQDAKGGRGGRAAVSSYRFSSVGTRFKKQLADLMAALHTMEPHYIRCIKPNSKNQPMDFESNNVLHQLRCGGVLEAVRISCAGFPTKMAYEDFVDHFWNLVPQLLDRADLSDAEIARAIVKQADLQGHQAGKTKMFLRAGQMAELDKLRTEMMNKAAITIQRCTRGHLARIYFRQRKAAVITLQAWTRAMLARKLAREMRQQKAALRIQTAWRMAAARGRFVSLRTAVMTLQAAWRGRVARSMAVDLRRTRAATRIQSTWRGSRERKRWLAYRHGIVAAQCCWRRKLARRELRKRRTEAREATKLLQDKQSLDAKLKETVAVLETVQNQRNELRQAYKEERAARDALEAALAEAAEGRETALAELRARLEEQLAAEVEAHATTRTTLEGLRKQVATLNTAAEAARAQLQAHSISSQQRTAQFERQKADLESAAAAVKSDLMTRLSNAIKQRDAAREEALLASQKLTQLQEELESGALAPPSTPSNTNDPGMLERAQRYMPSASPTPGYAAADANGHYPRTPASARRSSLGLADGVDGGESEMDKRQRELYSKQQHLLREQRSADQERLLSCISEDLGFHNGRPLAALVIFRSCLQWKTFQADRTQLFDRIINAMGSQIERQQENNACLSYWLSNTVTLLYLLQKNIKPASGGSYNARLRSPASRSFFSGKAGSFTSFFSRTASSPSASGAGLEASIHSGGVGGFRQVEAKYPALLFKQQLDAFVQKIFPMLRDNVKKEITPQLAACIHAPRTPASRSRRSHSINSNDATAPRPGAGGAAAQLSEHWGNILQVFDALLQTLQQSKVPPFLVCKLFQQLSSFVNVQLFNQLLLRRECCSFSNGEYVKTGLGEVEQWIHRAGSQWVGESWDQLKYIRQAVSFLVIHQKHNKSLEEITTDLCPVLSVQQLYRISTMYWDDRYGTETVSHEVLGRMKQLMVENNSAASHSFLLDDDSSIPFSLDDIQSLMDDKDMYGEVPVPKPLKESKNFDFLKRDLRRAGSLTDA